MERLLHYIKDFLYWEQASSLEQRDNNPSIMNMRKCWKIGKQTALLCLITTPFCANGWQSSLVESNWMPPHELNGLNFFTDTFIQDFSYAGYHRGETPLPNPDGPVFDIVSAYGADPTGVADSTSAIQNAIDAAAAVGGGVVWMPAGTYRLSANPDLGAILYIKHSNIVLRGAGAGQTHLFNESYQMRNKSIIEISPAASVNWKSPQSTPILLAQNYYGPAMELALESVDGLQVGEWIVLSNPATVELMLDINMGPGTDGVDWTQHLDYVVGVLQLRQIMAIDFNANTISIDAPTRWAFLQRDGASIYKTREHLQEVGLEGFSIGNLRHPGSTWGESDYNTAGLPGYEVHNSKVIHFNGAINSWMHDVSSYNPGNDNGTHLLSNGIVLDHCRGITLYKCSMQYSQYGGGGGNGYMVRLNAANECLLADCEVGHCRHGIVMWRMANSGNAIIRCYDHHTGEQTGNTKGSTSGAGSDHHGFFSHSNLFDSNLLEESFLEAAYRGDYGTNGHGMTSAQVTYWNTEGTSYWRNNPSGHIIHSQQFGQGYVIGTRGNASRVNLNEKRPNSATRTNPMDFLEGQGMGESLTPQSLYLYQLIKRFELLGIRFPYLTETSTEGIRISWNLPPGMATLLEKSTDLQSWNTIVELPASGSYSITADPGDLGYYRLLSDPM